MNAADKAAIRAAGRVTLTAAEQPIDAAVAEQRQKLRHALAAATKRLASGDDAGEIVLKLRTVIEDVAEQTQPQIFKTLTSAELDAAELQTEYLVEDVLARNQSTIIAATKKCLKTNIAIDLTLSLASRCSFLGKFYIPKAVRVALMSGESGDAVIQETARRIARSKPWHNLADYPNALWCFDLPRLGRPQTRRDLMKFIGDQALEVLIVDPAYLCLDLGDDAGNLFSVGKKLSELTDVQHATGCTIGIVHHCKKAVGDPYAIPELESISWSGFQEWARQWFLIGRREAYNPEAAGSHKLWFSVGGSAGHSGLFALDIEEGSRKDQGGRRWEVTVQNASTAIAETIEQRELSKASCDEQKTVKRIADDAAKLLKEYRKKPEGETETYFRKKAALGGDRAAPANDKLLEDGLIEACKITKNGREYDGFRLKPLSAGTTGNDRESSGNIPTRPDGEHAAGIPPLRGIPVPAHRDIEDSLSEDTREAFPLDHELANELFPAGAA